MALNLAVLDKQIGPFPVKIWLIIVIGGVGVGYLVTRNMGTKTPSLTGTNTADVAAMNSINQRLGLLSLENESITGQYSATNTLMDTLRDELKAIQNRILSQTPTIQIPQLPPNTVTDVPLFTPIQPDVRNYDSNGRLISFSYDTPYRLTSTV